VSYSYANGDVPILNHCNFYPSGLNPLLLTLFYTSHEVRSSTRQMLPRSAWNRELISDP
jgi:hypothetical protein